VPLRDPGGRFYEARVLCWLLGRLKVNGYAVDLRNGQRLTLRWSGGVLDRSFSFLRVVDGGKIVGEIWTDVWILSRKAHARACIDGVGYYREDHKELDIVVARPNPLDGRPICHEYLRLGIECKDRRTYTKDLLHSIYGMRSFMSEDSQKRYKARVRGFRGLPYRPPSVLIAAGTDAKITDYKNGAAEYGIEMRRIKYL